MDHTLLRALAALEAEIPAGVPRESYEISADRGMFDAFINGLRGLSEVLAPRMPSSVVSRVTL
jgi:hypothetical protein